MKSWRYYWERRKVVARGLKNWLRAAACEPWRPGVARGEPAIVFVALSARARPFNHADSLRRRHGIKTVLLTKLLDYEFQRQAFDEIRLFRGADDLRRQVERLGRRLRILAVISTNQPSWQTRALIDEPRGWPVIFDPYDSLWMLRACARSSDSARREIARLYSPGEEESEEECFRRADGVLLRVPYLDVLLRERGIGTPRMLFEDACNPRFHQPIRPRRGPKRGEWSVVYPGIFYPSTADPGTTADAQMAPLGRLFAEERIHLHLYPSPHHEYLYPDYRAEARRNPYFHLHPAVGFSRVHQVVARHDFGWYANDFSKTVFYSPESSRSCLSNKFYTYFEAGIPVLATRVSEYGVRLVEETGGGIAVEPGAPRGLGKLLDAADLGALLRGVERARERFDIHAKTDAFLPFLEGLSTGGLGGKAVC
ncbi:MAG: hypothetical protein ACRD2T_11600, partial [Thermoanaerobaculia bacterium]